MEITNDMKLRTGEAQRNKRWKDQFNLNKTKRTSGKTVWIEYRIEAEQAKRKKKRTDTVGRERILISLTMVNYAILQ